MKFIDEVVADVRCELRIGRVIEGLDADHLLRDQVIVLVKVADKIELRRGRPDDQDVLRAREPLRDSFEERRVQRVPALLLGLARSPS